MSESLFRVLCGVQWQTEQLPRRENKVKKKTMRELQSEYTQTRYDANGLNTCKLTVDQNYHCVVN